MRVSVECRDRNSCRDYVECGDDVVRNLSGGVLHATHTFHRHEGMALAAIGTYGLVSYRQQSTQEIGVRLALGAPALSVVRGFLARGLKLGAVGAALGLVVALGLSRLLGSACMTSLRPTSLRRHCADGCWGAVVVATLVPS